jgi:hypothetical protein
LNGEAASTMAANSENVTGRHRGGAARGRAGDHQHQAALQADGRPQGVRPVLHGELPDQDQDRGQIFPINKQILTPETVRQAAYG